MDISSLEKRAKVQLQFRILDGYPWAPAEVRIEPVFGVSSDKAERIANVIGGAKQAILVEANSCVSGWGSIEAAVAKAHNVL